MNHPTMIELEIWRGVASLLAPDISKMVWDEVRRGWDSSGDALGQSATDPEGMLRALRNGAGQLPVAQRRVVDAVAQRLSRARRGMTLEDAQEISLLEERQKVLDQARHLLETEEALRAAFAGQLGQSVDAPAVDAYVRNAAALTRGFYKVRQAVRGHAEGARFAAESVESFLMDGAMDPAILRSVQDAARQAERSSHSKRSFGASALNWAPKFVEALDSFNKREALPLRGESAAQAIRHWTPPRLSDPTQFDKGLDASLKMCRDLVDKRAEELAQFQAEREKIVHMASVLNAELREIERVVDTEEGFAIFGKKMAEMVESMKRLLRIGPDSARLAELARLQAPKTPSPGAPKGKPQFEGDKTFNMNDLLLDQEPQKKSD